MGTGGKSLYSFEDAKPNSEIRSSPNSEIRSSEVYGVIRFDLKADGYDREFVPIEDNVFGDWGNGVCH